MSEVRPRTADCWRAFTAADLSLIEDTFAAAVECGATARLELVADRCAGRPDLRAEVEALLASHARMADEGSPADTDLPHTLSPGSLVGQYRIISTIAEGGMGAVYLAERADALFAHRVAIKLLRTLRAQEEAQRFRAERQILASLNHPQIVTLLDGGTTADGQGYLVMEYVDGQPITQYCRDRRVPLHDRLQLVRQVCAAVQYAHQHGIVHRDLKPANILVTADGGVKVLDFGIAKLLEEAPDGTATLTQGLGGPLTPNYASPEQLRGLAVTTASDVYALGVLTYEIATGLRPYETHGKALDEVLDLVVKTNPPRPSTARARADRDDGAVDGYPARPLAGDLDAIVAKAMRKEPQERYGSAGELSDDVRRYLNRQPVVARDPSAFYVLSRLASRHRATVAAAALALLAVLGALGVAVWQRQVAVAAQARAERRFRDVRQLSNALIFKIHDAVAPLAGSTPVRHTIVAEAVAYLEKLQSESADDPSLQLELAAAYRQIGSILGDPQRPNLGDLSGALKQLERARQLALGVANGPAATFDALAAVVGSDRQLADIVSRTDRARGRGYADEAVDYARRAFDRPSRDPRARRVLANALFTKALHTEGRDRVDVWEAASRLFEEELAAKPTDLDRIRNVALVEKYRGGAYENLDDWNAAALHYTRALEMDERRGAADPKSRQAQMDLAIDYANVGNIASEQGDLGRAAELYSKSLQIREALLASDPQDAAAAIKVGAAAWRYARVERQRGHYAEAAAAAERARVVLQSERVLPDTAAHREFGSALFELGLLAEHDKRQSAACGLYRQSVAAFASFPGPYEQHIEDAARNSAAACAKR